MKTNSKNIIDPQLDHSLLSKTWSEPGYESYITGASTWSWRQLPKFNSKPNYLSGPEQTVDGSILEIGSAAGGAYRYLQQNDVLATEHNYTGIDISDMGISYCKEKHPEAEWLQADLTTHSFSQKYDYCFERIAIHHMPNPLSIIDKLSKVTEKSIATSFVSCLEGSTISDLKVARYRGATGELYYFDIINPFEMIEVLFDNGFHDVGLYYGGPHEPIYTDPLALQYLSPEISQRARKIGRSTLIASRGDPDKLNAFLINCDSRLRHAVKWCTSKYHTHVTHKAVIQERLKQLNTRTYGVLYRSAYQNR